HGDASFAAQGVVAETFNLARLKGYTTGGTIHLIANNQLGFTTDPREGRSTDYSSDLAKGFDVPIIHVNADDPEACLAAARLAMMYRDKFHAGVVIDVVGYRRHGHNEGDEPAYTQPLLYERIKRTPTVRQRYAEQLAGEGIQDVARADALAFASLVVEGTPTRLTGQDTERGTFSQRHLVLHDTVNGQRYAPIQNLPGARAPFELHNSPLSEFACLGFEYGYAAAAPD